MTLRLALVGFLSACTNGVLVDDDVDEQDAWEFSADNPDTMEHRDEVVGVAVRHPGAWSVVRDEILFETHGFLLSEIADPDDPHGVLPVARVALDYARTPDAVREAIDAKRAEFPDVVMTESRVVVDGHEAIALGPVPGGMPSTNVYLAVDDRVVRINYFREELDPRGRALLAAVHFETPTKSVGELGLLPADAPEVLFGPGRSAPIVETRPLDSPSPILAAPAGGGGYVMSDGCYAQPGGFFIQTTHSWDANGTGWSRMGTPNFWGERTHGNWGLGRCVSGYYTNDLYAIDYYLRSGDRLFSPFKSAYVVYAGWDPENWWNYGKMVVLVDPTGRFYSLSAHMSYVNVVRGQHVTDDTLIGWGGSTGYAAPYPHVHQVFYQFASTSYGRPYAGRGMMQTALSYLGNGGGTYTNFWKGKWASW
jgi:hypothetical protein